MKPILFFVLDHDQAEIVKLTVCQYTDQGSQVLAEDSFMFTSDSSEFLAQQLVANSLDPKALRQLENVYNSILNVPLVERRGLDTRLITSFRNLTRINTWSLADDHPGINYLFSLILDKRRSEIRYRIEFILRDCSLLS